MLWRVFPWDPQAEEGQPFSASFVPGGQGGGRFDLPESRAGVLYLAEAPEHAIAERLQVFRNQTVDAADLRLAGHGLALTRTELPDDVWERGADLCDAAELARHGVGPDELAARSRGTTQRIGRSIHAAGHTGFRWWSAFFGEWHTIVLFRDRLDRPPGYGPPELLRLDTPALVETARLLDIELLV